MTWYVPVPHCGHFVSPTPDEKEPNGQRAHALDPPADAKVPSLQSWQPLALSDPELVEYLPRWQSEHALDPPADAKVPSLQSWQPLALSDPELVEYFPILQSLQLNPDTAPVDV